MSDQPTPAGEPVSKNAQKKAEKAAKAAAEKAAKAAAKAAAPAPAGGKKAPAVNEEELDPSVRKEKSWSENLMVVLLGDASSDQVPRFWLP